MPADGLQMSPDNPCLEESTTSLESTGFVVVEMEAKITLQLVGEPQEGSRNGNEIHWKEKEMALEGGLFTVCTQ